jgi:flagellar hook assembly protein FlgD
VKSIDFEVVQEVELAITNVLNYPNPFTTRTEFWFEHNQACSLLDVQVQVYTISGRLVKSINQSMQTEGYRSEPIAWDGLDDFGDRLARGVYVYKLRVSDNAGKAIEVFEKLVILN